MNGKRAYRIWSPKYTHRSGGIRVLYRLSAILRSMGYEATINDEPANKNYVAVYPEVVPCPNPFGSDHVVYYQLNHSGLLGGMKEFPFGRQCFWYISSLNPPPDAFMLTIPTLELELFNQKGTGRRDTTCSWVGKAGILGYMKGNPLGENHITYRWPKTRGEVAALLKKSTILYCYDGLSILPMEAALCGCPTVILEEGPFKKADAIKSEFGTAGIGWGMEELEEAKKTIPQALPNYLKVEAALPAQIKQFIELTQGM